MTSHPFFPFPIAEGIIFIPINHFNMLRQITLCLVLALPCLALAQKKDKSAVKFANTITADDMKKHLYTIASKEFEGRETPSPGLEKAANYIETNFRNFGLLPGNNGSYRLQYPLYRDSMLSSNFTINGIPYQLNKDYQPLTSNFSGELRFSEVVFAGYGIVDEGRDDYSNLKVAGKLVMVVDGGPSDFKPSRRGFRSSTSMFGKITAAMNNGATGLLIVSTNFPRRMFNATSNWSLTGYKASQSPFTFEISQGLALSILGKDGENLLERVKTNEVPLKTYSSDIAMTYMKTTKTTYVSNVMGMIEGTDKKDEYVFLTAHYDHIGKRDTVINYGADDDGSGTTGILELAQAFSEAKKAGKGPRRTIIFMTVSGEEKGLWGSNYYSNHPVYPLDKTSVDLNIDMIGRIDTIFDKKKDSLNYVYVIGDDKLSSDLAPITEEVNKTYMKMNLDRRYNDLSDPNRFYYRSDHYNFADKGVPIIFYFNGVHADYHRPTDTPDKINYPLMARRAQLVFYTAWNMANRDEMLKRDIPLEKPKGF